MVVGTTVQQVTTNQQPATSGARVVDAQTLLPVGVPTSRAEYRALLDMRGELSNQLQSAAGRRNDLAEQLKTADPDARAGILDRLKVLDDRIVKLETEIERTGVLVANTPPALIRETRTVVGQTPGLGRSIGDNIVPLTGIVSTFFLLPLAIAMARSIWRRGSEPPRTGLTDVGVQRQLEQMQQSIDTIAIEVERISESQRFVTKLMSDRSVGAGHSDPLRVGHQSAVPAERG
jgi:hypothetical protein